MWDWPHEAIKAFTQMFLATQTSTWYSHCEIKVHLLLANRIRAVCSVRDCWSAKMLLSAVTVGQVHDVLCLKLSLSTAYPSKSNKSYKLVIRLWSLYAAKHGLPTAWFTLPWFYTSVECSGVALDLQQCKWEGNQLWETRSGLLTFRFSWLLRKNCINQASCLFL